MTGNESCRHAGGGADCSAACLNVYGGAFAHQFDPCPRRWCRGHVSHSLANHWLGWWRR